MSGAAAAGLNRPENQPLQRKAASTSRTESSMNPLRSLIAILAITTMSHADSLPIDAKPNVLVNTTAEPVAPGKFEPTWRSLQQYATPAWFRDAKFGIWAHWGPQCEPERGDWYARGMYEEGSGQYRSHVERYGHPSKVGFKDVIHEWNAENWRPEELVALYKRAGAQYFFAMANHHDNLDLWDSKHHAWNSVRVARAGTSSPAGRRPPARKD